jgi:hypothetical protein
MSEKTFLSALAAATRSAGGAHLTIEGREKHFSQFAEWCYQNSFQLHQVEQIKDKHIGRFVQDQLSRGLSKRTIQNQMSSIRAALRGAGRDRYADGPTISNERLGIDGASRIGTKTAMADADVRRFVIEAGTLDRGVAVCLELQRVLGLREKEATMCVQSLYDWQKQLLDGKQVHVSHGTKGGRVRWVTPADRVAALQVVNRAIVIAGEQRGKLIDKPDLKSALNRYSYVCSRIGMTGQLASHSLRYAFAQDHLRNLQNVGVRQKEARSIVSQYLGHGDGRGRWVASVYGR